MTSQDVLHRLSVLGARIECKDGKIVLCVGAQAIPHELIAATRACKAELATALVNAGDLQPGTAWGHDEEERAAIVEHDGTVPRAWAEGFSRLDPDHPPGDVPPDRWQRFVDDVGLFLDSPFCAIAASLGWGPFDLFGCDRAKPFGRIDKCGLIWLLNGRTLVALSENTATIVTRTGARQTYYRWAERRGEALAWELVQ